MTLPSTRALAARVQNAMRTSLVPDEPGTPASAFTAPHPMAPSKDIVFHSGVDAAGVVTEVIVEDPTDRFDGTWPDIESALTDISGSVAYDVMKARGTLARFDAYMAVQDTHCTASSFDWLPVAADMLAMASEDADLGPLKITPTADFDFRGFDAQDIEHPVLRIEWIKQRAGIAGDDYYGTLAWTLGAWTLSAEFSC